MNKILSKLKNEKGQSLVEFALVLIIFLVIFFAITEFGRAWYRADLLKGAANIAARTYAVQPDEPRARTEAKKVISTLQDSDITFDPISTSIRVTVRESFKSVVPFLGTFSNITTIRRNAVYRIEE